MKADMKHRANDKPGFHQPRTAHRGSGNTPPRGPRCGQKPAAAEAYRHFRLTVRTGAVWRIITAIVNKKNVEFTHCPEFFMIEKER